MKMELGDIKTGEERIEVETSIDGSHSSVAQPNEDNDIKILKWQFELMLNAMDGPRSSSK